MINGNHEEEDTYSRYQFKDEIKEKFTKNIVNKIEIFTRKLPIGVILKRENEKAIFFCHGGFDKNDIFPDSNIWFLGDQGFDYLWADFVMDENPIQDGSGRRKISPIETKKWLQDNYFQCIISGHQDTISVGIQSDLGASTPLGWEINGNPSYFSSGGRQTSELLTFDPEKSDSVFVQNKDIPYKTIYQTQLPDFLASVTSTAVTTYKGIKMDTWLHWRPTNSPRITTRDNVVIKTNKDLETHRCSIS